MNKSITYFHIKKFIFTIFKHIQKKNILSKLTLKLFLIIRKKNF